MNIKEYFLILNDEDYKSIKGKYKYTCENLENQHSLFSGTLKLVKDEKTSTGYQPIMSTNLSSYVGFWSFEHTMRGHGMFKHGAITPNSQKKDMHIIVLRIYEAMKEITYNEVKDTAAYPNFIPLHQRQDIATIEHIGQAYDITSALNIMDNKDPKQKMAIYPNSDINFLFDYAFYKDEIQRNIQLMHDRYAYPCGSLLSDLQDKADCLNKENAVLNENNIINIKDNLILLNIYKLQLMIEPSANKREAIAFAMMDLMEITNVYDSTLFKGIDKDLVDEICDFVVNKEKMSDSRKALTILKYIVQYVSEDKKLDILDVFYKARYTKEIISFFYANLKDIDRSKISAQKLKKQASLHEYNVIMDVPKEKCVINETFDKLATAIELSNTYSLSAQLDILTLYINSLTMEELKNANLNSIFMVLNKILVSKFISDFCSSGDYIKTMKNSKKIDYFCEKFIAYVITANSSCASRIKIILKYSSPDTSLSKQSLLCYFNRAVQKRNDSKIRKILMEVL